MTYEERLSEQLHNLDANLGFLDSSIPSYLDGIADDAFHQGDPAGFLAALSIWHQLAEEILRLLYRYSQALSRAALYPVKLDEMDLLNQSMGQLIQIQKRCVRYECKSIILSRADSLNKLRNTLFHDIKSHPTEVDIIEEAKPCKKLFEELFAAWHVALKWFWRQFDSVKKRKEIVSLLLKHPRTGRLAR